MNYSLGMTLPDRNCFFKAGIFISLAALAGIGTAFRTALPFYPELLAMAAARSRGVIQAFAGQFLPPSPYAPFAAMIAAVLYSLSALILIYCFFEKTQAPEILFIALFAVSFAFEAARLIVPLASALELPGLYFTAACRILVFGRYFGLFSLFTAGVCASGLEIREPGNLILLTAGMSMASAVGMPLDSLSWDTALCLSGAYTSMFSIVESVIILITTASFLAGAYIRGAREYVAACAGSLLAGAGRSLLLPADTWAAVVSGFAILAAGTWLICSRLRRIYLWL
jgi:hypothetical protein